jgi:hypothetical protein
MARAPNSTSADALRTFLRPQRLLWILAGIAVLLALAFMFVLVPAIERARNSGTKFNCRGRLKRVGIAMYNYADQNGGRFPDLDSSGPGDPPQSWRIAVLPFLGHEKLHSTYSPPLTWEAVANRPTAQAKLWEMSCPLNNFSTDELGRRYTDFAAVSGPQTAFPGGKGMEIEAISKADGLSQTTLLGECCGLNIVWTEPRDIDTAKQKIGINLAGDGPHRSSSILSSSHRGGAFVVFADGDVRFLSEKIDQNVLKALTTATGGEPLPNDYK